MGTFEGFPIQDHESRARARIDEIPPVRFSSRIAGEGTMNLPIETGRDADGRRIAEIITLAGIMVHGRPREEAISRVQALDLKGLAGRLEHGGCIAGR